MAKKIKKVQRLKGNSGVSKVEVAFWLKHYSWGDYHKIKRDKGLSRPTIKAAFGGDATSDVSEKITDFYLKKQSA
jgi:hypothetical protein